MENIINEYILHLEEWMAIYILLIWVIGITISAGVLKRFYDPREEDSAGFAILICIWPLYLIVWLPFYKLYKLGCEIADKETGK